MSTNTTQESWTHGHHSHASCSEIRCITPPLKTGIDQMSVIKCSNTNRQLLFSVVLWALIYDQKYPWPRYVWFISTFRGVDHFHFILLGVDVPSCIFPKYWGNFVNCPLVPKCHVLQNIPSTERGIHGFS
jgi:hypothetical protein